SWAGGLRVKQGTVALSKPNGIAVTTGAVTVGDDTNAATLLLNARGQLNPAGATLQVSSTGTVDMSAGTGGHQIFNSITMGVSSSSAAQILLGTSTIQL